jgi:hypothetical protein
MTRMPLRKQLRGVCGVVAAALVLVVGCSGSSSTSVPTGVPTGDASADGATGREAGADGGLSSDAGGARAWCAALGEKQDRCDQQRECGPNFDAWCAQQSLTNSRAFEAADTSCVAVPDCKSATRADCRYQKYQPSQLTASQRSLITAYCATCSVTNCEQSLTTYDATKGPSGVSDAYVAAWELSDAITDKIRDACTGAALPGRDGNCPAAFGNCAAGVYLDALPECPK